MKENVEKDHQLETCIKDRASIVIPIYNEEDSIPYLYKALKTTLDDLECETEIIFVDDGSRDKSFQLLSDIQKRDRRVMVIGFRRNFGQTAAISAGFNHATGDVIITMDADLQNDPKDIPRLLEASKKYDVVSGWRKDRKDKLLTRRVPSMIANWLISEVTGVHLHDYGCTLKAYKKEVVNNINLYGEMHRFIPAIADWVGASITEIETIHHPRRFGTSKYGIFRTVRVVLDLITVKFLQSFSTRPIHAFGPAGLLLSGIGLLMGLYLTYEKILMGQNIGGRPLLLLAILLIILGVQLVIMGLLGEMIARVYHESQNKPIYIIKKVLKRNE